MSLEVTNVSLLFFILFFFFLFIPYSVKGADAGNVIRLFIPDIGMFIASLTIWLLCRSLVQKPVTEDAAQCNTQFENEEMVSNTHFCLSVQLIANSELWYSCSSCILKWFVSMTYAT